MPGSSQRGIIATDFRDFHRSRLQDASRHVCRTNPAVTRFGKRLSSPYGLGGDAAGNLSFVRLRTPARPPLLARPCEERELDSTRDFSDGSHGFFAAECAMVVGGRTSFDINATDQGETPLEDDGQRQK